MNTSSVITERTRGVDVQINQELMKKGVTISGIRKIGADFVGDARLPILIPVRRST
jgi:hypothetical protein